MAWEGIGRSLRRAALVLCAGALMAAASNVPAASAAPVGPMSPTTALDQPLLLKGKAGPVYVLVRLEARPSAEDAAKKRPPLNLALVLDRSGSMADAGKLDYLKRAASLLVDQLTPRDILSIVEYDDQITLMVPAGPVESASQIKRLIENLQPRGTTNLTGGMLRGVDEVKHALKARLAGPDAVARVLLLSDGLANEGVTEPQEIRELVRKARRDGAPISTLGLGRDYDEDLMQDIAENGGGRYHYIEHPDQMSRIFAEELKTLFGTVLRDCVIEVQAGDAVKGIEILGFPEAVHERGAKLALGDFYGGEKRSLLLRLDVNPQTLGKLELGHLKLSYLDAKSGAVQNFDLALAAAVTDDAVAAEKAVDREVAIEATLAEAEREQVEAVRLYEAGDHAGAGRRMSQLLADVGKKNATLNDVRVAKKLEALSVEQNDMASVAAAPAEQSAYLKRTKQRLFQAKQGVRSLSMLKEGDKGYEVKQLQEALHRSGHYRGPLNGEYNADTTAAVKAFQEEEKIGSDGVAGPATMKELGLY